LLIPVLTALIFLAGPRGLAVEAAASGEAPTLRALKITGAKAIPKKKIVDELNTPSPSRWPWKKPPVFRPRDLEDDLERLRLLYRRQGFYHARITSKVSIAKHRADVEINIKEGPEVKVTRVEVAAEDGFSPQALSELRSKRPLKAGERFTEENYESLKQLYLNYLLDRGYPRALVQGRVNLDEEKNTAEVELAVKPGPLCYFGDVRLRGKPETPERVILRKITFKKGAPFSFKDLYDSQQRIYALDLFQSVNLTPEDVPENERHIPVIVEVQEKKKRSLKVGLGYGSEDEFRARLGVRFRNLAGGGRMLDVDTKFSRREHRVEATFSSPLILRTNNDFVFQTGYIRRYLPGFTDKAFFAQTRLERELPWKFKGYLGHGLEFTRPFNIPEETLLRLSETEAGKLYRASMILIGLRRETMDNAIDPHRGSQFSLAQEVAPQFMGSQIQFLRTIAEVRRYQSLGNTDFILAGRLKFGIIEPIQSTSDIPVFRRFFAGGYNSVRGYRLDYLGPRNLSGTPLGGEALLEGSLEFRIPLYKELRAVTFLDFGNVYLKIKDIDAGQLKYSSGVGLRYHTFFGPIGVDVGFPINPIDPHKDRYRFHFTIGHSF
jgi:outer membrane protein assembly complex protein YaeT